VSDRRSDSGPSERYRPDEDWARQADAEDSLAEFRSRFRIPRDDEGRALVYFCGNSLGLQPIEADTLVRQELDAWARLAVDAHFDARSPWYTYHEQFREVGARLVGGVTGEVVMMNSLTVNLHLMMVSFFRPTADRHKILIEDCAFPSDRYAVQSQLEFHGYDPREALVVARPLDGDVTLRTETLEQLLNERGHEIALVLLGGVNYYTGQFFDLPKVTSAARRQGCSVGLDLAHAVGNVPLELHDWEVDFAVWCSYKYLNAGPGAVAGCFVHQRHGRRGDLPRFAGWWGNDPEQRFRVHLNSDFEAVSGADGWQLSNPPILAMAPLRAALDVFDEAGMAALRLKSERLTGYLEYLLAQAADPTVEILTPRDPAARGCQISLRLSERARERFDALHEQGVIGDFREPDVIRLAPVPLYNSFHDVWRAGCALAVR
jgi:kynureninase